MATLTGYPMCNLVLLNVEPETVVTQSAEQFRNINTKCRSKMNIQYINVQIDGAAWTSRTCVSEQDMHNASHTSQSQSDTGAPGMRPPIPETDHTTAHQLDVRRLRLPNQHDYMRWN